MTRSKKAYVPLRAWQIIFGLVLGSGLIVVCSIALSHGSTRHVVTGIVGGVLILSALIADLVKRRRS